MNTKNFRFHMPVAVHYGVGIAHNMTGRIRGERVMIVCDPFLYQSGVAEKLGGALEGKTVSYFSGIEPNPSTVSVDVCAEAARVARAETVIGVGSGSAMDVAKVVACLVTNGGSIYDYYAGGTKRFGPRAVKLILIPTTAGTGSEVTNVGVYTNPRAGVKMPFVTDEFWADEALIDPEMTYSLPPAVTASTGMDAFCHAIEAYWNKESQPMCDFLAMGALKTILENIKAAYDHPDDTAARGAMITAALVAGVAFSQTRTTGIHAVSFPLTTEFHASHGAACSITLPAFIRAAKQGAAEKLRVLAGYLGYADAGALADGVEALMRSMKMPVRLRELGVREADIPHIAEVGLTAAIIQLTPAEMNQETVEALLRSIL